MQYTINRRDGKPICTVEIDCPADAAERKKLGLAVIAAVNAGASLEGVIFKGADLRGAYLVCADLGGANLRGAIGVIDGGQRSDSHRFVAVRHDHGPKILAGCRWFTLPEARAHWAERHIGTPLHAETLAKLDMIETTARAHGWPMPEETK